MPPTKKKPINVTQERAKPPIPQELIDEKIRILEEQIRALEEQVRALKTERNLGTPIFKLPPEVLIRIFTSVRDMKLITRWSENWVSLTYVCRLWRQVALDDPRLWVRLDLSSEGWFDATLERSKSVPIWIIYNPYESDIDILRKAMAYSAHCCALSISQEAWHDRVRVELDEMTDELDGLGKHMHSLRLKSCIEKMPRSLLLRIGPQLHYLHLDMCDIDWESFYTSVNVGYLCIHNPKSLPNPIELLKYLKTITKLEHLSLGNVLGRDSGAILADITPGSVILSHLRHLYLSGKDLACDIRFLAALRCPNDARVIFSSNIISQTKTHLLQELIGTIVSNRISEVVIEGLELRTCGFSSTLELFSTSNTNPFISVYIFAESNDCPFKSLPEEILSLPLSNLQRITLSLSSRPVPAFLTMIKSLENLHTLIVYGGGSDNFLNQISTNPIDFGDNGSYPFPRLKTLGIGGAYFDYDALHEGLKLRKKHGFMLDEIKLVKCYDLPKGFDEKMRTVSRTFVKDDTGRVDFACEISNRRFPDLFY